MRSSLFWDVTQCILVVTDVSVRTIGPIKSQSSWTKIVAVIGYNVECQLDATM